MYEVRLTKNEEDFPRIKLAKVFKKNKTRWGLIYSVVLLVIAQMHPTQLHCCVQGKLTGIS
jgi:hypothetical protein